MPRECLVIKSIANLICIASLYRHFPNQYNYYVGFCVSRTLWNSFSLFRVAVRVLPSSELAHAIPVNIGASCLPLSVLTNEGWRNGATWATARNECGVK